MIFFIAQQIASFFFLLTVRETSHPMKFIAGNSIGSLKCRKIYRIFVKIPRNNNCFRILIIYKRVS